MKRLIYPLIFLLSLSSTAQIHEEFMATVIGDKEAFLSSKTGEFVYRAHDKTDVSALYTTDSGTVIYEDRKVHKVKKGETLSSIAKKHSISISQLKTQNKMKSSGLSIGQELRIVIKNVVNSSKPVVKQAEGKIIARLAPGQMPGGMTPPDLPPDAMPGNTINLVTDNTKPQAAQAVEEKVETLNDDGTITHIVKGGETLFAIARKYKVSVKDVKETNKLALNTLSPGQKLKIKVYNPEAYRQNKQPEADVETATVVEDVQKQDVIVEATKVVAEDKLEDAKEDVSEDAINTIAEDLGEVIEDVKEAATQDTTEEVEEVVEEIKEEAVKEVPHVNDKKEAVIDGLIEKYSKKEETSTSVTNDDTPEKTNEKETTKVHIVKKGESLWAISRQYKMTVAELSALNNLKNNNLSIGQKLKVK